MMWEIPCKLQQPPSIPSSPSLLTPKLKLAGEVMNYFNEFTGVTRWRLVDYPWPSPICEFTLNTSGPPSPSLPGRLSRENSHEPLKRAQRARWKRDEKRWRRTPIPARSFHNRLFRFVFIGGNKGIIINEIYLVGKRIRVYSCRELLEE